VARLDKYREMRKLDRTPEPAGAERIRPLGKRARGRFVVQRHRATRLHYDFRLEIDGVLVSWAVPKGPTLAAGEKRLAMQTEDHPLDYFDFEGVIPEGNYGAGDVIVWDWGQYELAEGTDARSATQKGRIKFRLEGKKLRGLFTLVRMKGRSGEENAWLLFKDRDEACDQDFDVDALPKSVKSGRTNDEVKSAPDATWTSNRLPHVAPMLATLVDAPFDDDDWVFELKWDGIRAICTVGEDGHVVALSRNDKDLLPRFPALGGLAKALRKKPAIVDGEVVVLDAEGRSSFQALQRGGHGARHAFVVFDALYVEDRDLRGEPLEERKKVLASLLKAPSRIEGGGASMDVLFSTHVPGKGRDLFALARKEGLEGVVAKRRDAPYVGKRSRDWLKFKTQQMQDCVIAGYTAPKGARTAIGALLLGVYEKGRLVHCGQVGTGLDSATLRELKKKLGTLEIDECPFSTTPKGVRARWVRPELVCEVEFYEWTADRRMRHPVFRGLRDDKRPDECVREAPDSKAREK
jgi:bifunctional non-homologous end joining protein LigD